MENVENLHEQIEKLQQQLVSQEKMASLGLLSAGIAHEIQNPLNFVINFSKLSVKLLNDLLEVVDDCKDKLTEDEAADIEDISADLQSNLKKISEHGERAISIIQGILLQSRGKAGEKLPTDVCKLTHEYVWLSYHAMRARNNKFNITIREDYPDNLKMQLLVPQDFSRAILNVVNNAFYAVWEKAQQEEEGYEPTVSVTVKQEGNQLLILIADNGNGIPDEIQQKMFHEVITTKPVGKGTGLGMSITRQLMEENLEGSISFTTEMGSGTTFKLIIPYK